MINTSDGRVSLEQMARRTQPYRLAVVAIVWVAASHGFASGQTSVEDYLRELRQLDNSRPESTCIARDSLRELMLTSGLAEREKMFRAFRAFYFDAVSRTAPAFMARMYKYVNDYEQWLQSAQANDSMQQFLKDRPDIAEAGSRWFKCGFSMYDGEGSLYPEENPIIMLSFANRLGTSLSSYVRFRAVEDRERVIDDAAIEISWEQLRLKLESWEAFERRHQELPEVKSEIEPGIQSLAILYLFGSDNTPTFDPRGFIDPKLIASWSKFAADDRSSRYHTLISSLVANINEQNQTITQQDRFLFARVGMGDSFDQWWRLLQLRLTER